MKKVKETHSGFYQKLIIVLFLIFNTDFEYISKQWLQIPHLTCTTMLDKLLTLRSRKAEQMERVCIVLS